MSPTVGRPVNPKIVETQLSGAAIMQLGFTLFEKMEFDAGQVTNASLADYKIPGILDVPARSENEAVDAEQRTARSAPRASAKPHLRVSPAIANAIDDALGVRLTELPINAEVVFRALARRRQQAAGGRRETTMPHDQLHAQRRAGQRPRSSRITSWSSCCSANSACSGARESCGQGLCGCCTVLVDGRAVSGCLFLAAFVDGAEVDHDRALGQRRHAASGAGGFIEAGAFQCGFCTPGFVLMTTQLLDAHPDPTTTRSATISPAISAAAPPIRRSSRR